MTACTLPTRPRLRAGVTLLHRRDGEVQLGLDPHRAVVLTNLPPAVLAALRSLTGGPTTADLLTAVDSHHRPTLLTALSALTTRGLVEDAAAPATGLPGRLRPDATASALRGSPHPPDRSDHAVWVRGTSRLAATVATLLAASGVGRVHVTAPGEVAPEDTGTALLTRDIGNSRQTAIHQAIRRVDESTATHRFTRNRPDLVLLTDSLVPDPTLAAHLTQEGIPHLTISSRDGVGLVGPLVIPRRSSCLRCAHHHRTDNDPCWPTLAAQLAGRTQPTDLSTAHATAGLATTHTLQALTWLHDGARATPPTTWNTTLELDPVTAHITHRTWPPHPSCPCGAAPALYTADQPKRPTTAPPEVRTKGTRHERQRDQAG